MVIDLFNNLKLSGAPISTKAMGIREVARSLPVFQYREIIRGALRQNRAMVIAAETGSGKTSEVPLFVMEELGRDARIIVSSPRKIGCISCANYAASHLDEPIGSTVGYFFKGDNRTGSRTRLTFATEGSILALYRDDRYLRQVDCLIVDEAHERSEWTDALLGVCKMVLSKRRDFRIIIMSATIETQRFCHYFGTVTPCPLFTIPGRRYAIHTAYLPEPAQDEDAIDTAIHRVLTCHKVEEMRDSDKAPERRVAEMKDILVFVPGTKQMRRMASALRSEATLKKLNLEVLTLKATMRQELKDYVLDAGCNDPRRNPSVRRAIISTNIAETSLTLKRTGIVVDTGLVKCRVFNPATLCSALIDVIISVSQANQRSGRGGRTGGDGVAYRLFTRHAFEHQMSKYAVAAISRIPLEGLTLKFLCDGLGFIELFPWLTPPPALTVDLAYRNLLDLGAINTSRNVTADGRLMGSLGVDPKYGKAIVSAARNGVLLDVVAIVAMVSGDLVYEEYTKEEAAEVSARWREFAHESGDHLTMMNILYRYLKIERQEEKDAFCRRCYFSAGALRKAENTFETLLRKAAQLGLSSDRVSEKKEATRLILRSLLDGLVHNVARLVDVDGSPRQYYHVTRKGMIPVHIQRPCMMIRQEEYILFSESVVGAHKNTMRFVSAADGRRYHEIAPGAISAEDRGIYHLSRQ